MPLGRGTDCERIAPETWALVIIAHGRTVSAAAATLAWRFEVPAMGLVCPNHAHGIVACDLFATVTARFRVPRRLRRPRGRHASNPALEPHRASDGAVAIQQFRAVITPETSHRFVLHDRDSVYSATFDHRSALCERLIGTTGWECLDSLIPMHEAHLRRVLREWVAH